jgi:hypothetical protein
MTPNFFIVIAKNCIKFDQPPRAVRLIRLIYLYIEIEKLNFRVPDLSQENLS